MRQCLLRHGIRYQTAWIPSKYAVRGIWLKLRGEDNWRVVAVYPLWQEAVDLPHGYFAGGISH